MELLYNNSPTKRWIKLINFEKTVYVNKYDRKDYFEYVAEITLDNEKSTVIKFSPTIEKNLFNQKSEWLYLFTINDKIVKIGGTRVGLKGRIQSYLCGHHTVERGKTGDCSKTNAFIYNTFEFYLKLGYHIKMYGYKLPIKEISVNIFNNDYKVIAQTFHTYESIFLDDYKSKYGSYPLLNDNCDPQYKK